MRVPPRFLAAFILGALAFASISPAAAQQNEPAPFVIEFHEQLDFILQDWGGIDALVGQTVCGSLPYPTEDRRLVLGGPGTAPECNQSCRVVNLAPIGGNSAVLSNNIVLMSGESVLIETLMPFPSTDGPNVPPFWIEIQVGEDITQADLRALGSLTAYIDGVVCGRVSFASDETLYTLPVGHTGRPDRCREMGAEIVLVDAHGQQLAVRPSVVGHTVFYTLLDLTLDPQGRRILVPNAAGNAGFAGSTNDLSIESLLVLLTVLGATVFGARRATRPRR